MPPLQNQRISSIQIVAVVCVLVGLSIVAYLVWQRSDTGAATTSPSQNVLVPSPDKRMALGTIDSISGQKILLKNFQKISDNLSASSVSPSASLTVVVGSATSIQRLVPQDPTILQKEQAAYLKKVQARSAQSTTTPPTPPQLFVRQTIALKDLKVGDVILAYASENIANLDSFTAVKIEIQSSQSQ